LPQSHEEHEVSRGVFFVVLSALAFVANFAQPAKNAGEEIARSIESKLVAKIKTEPIY
jgi:hypothetical protein